MRSLVVCFFVAQLLGSAACASNPGTSRSEPAALPPGEYRLTASVPVRADTERHERTETVAIEAELAVSQSGMLALSADTGPCVELPPSKNQTSSRFEKRFECGEASYAIEALRGLPSGFVTRVVNDFVRQHTGCRRMIRQNERDVCVEEDYTVLHRRTRRSARLRAQSIANGSR